jgi:hypothetical protein
MGGGSIDNSQRRWVATKAFRIGAVGMLSLVVLIGSAIAAGIWLPGLHPIPNGDDFGAFAEGFWPQLAATFIGVVAGIPAAVFVNRKLGERSERDRLEFDRTRLQNILVQLQRSLARNAEIIPQVVERIGAGSVYVVTHFDVARWSLISDQASRLIADPVLVGDLAEVYAQVQRLNDAVNLHRDVFIGLRTSSLPAGANHEREQLLTHVAGLIPELASDLAAAIENCQIRLDSVLSDSRV